MNERIRELAEQAEQYVNNAMDERANNKDFTFGDIDEMYNKKFAELIIEECAKVVERNLYQNIGWNTARKVKEHFGIGVEE